MFISGNIPLHIISFLCCGSINHKNHTVSILPISVSVFVSVSVYVSVAVSASFSFFLFCTEKSQLKIKNKTEKCCEETDHRILCENVNC